MKELTDSEKAIEEGLQEGYLRTMSEEELIDLEVKKAIQERYCKEHKIPNFTPSDGICWSCHKQIFHKLTKEQCESEHITGCPICCRSYCD